MLLQYWVKALRGKTNRPITWHEIRMFATICWRQGLVRSTRLLYWWQLLRMIFSKRRLVYDYLTVLGVGEHFFNYRYEVRTQLRQKLTALKQVQQETHALKIAV
ncbi:MAG: DUF4070 domain-containing protein [Calothrix sp. FI2-JRJ7]|nr:DUF4070 domain-containing protein [Calothrix sp. FI2-JRJ7]